MDELVFMQMEVERLHKLDCLSVQHPMICNIFFLDPSCCSLVEQALL